MKKFILASLVAASTLMQANDLDAFKKGFKVGLESVDYQLNHEGFEPQRFTVESPYALVWNIDKVPTADILYLQHLLKRDGVLTTLTKNFLLIDTFDRLADARELAQQIQARYAVKLEIKELADETIETYPVLFASKTPQLRQKFLKPQRKAYTTPLQVKMEKKEISLSDIDMSKKRYQASAVKNFALKNNAVGMTYNYKADKALTCDGRVSGRNCYKEAHFTPSQEYKKGEQYKRGGVFLRDDGIKLQKVLNKNLFFFLEDVEN